MSKKSKGSPLMILINLPQKFFRAFGANIYAFFYVFSSFFDQNLQFFKHFQSKNAYFRKKFLPAVLFLWNFYYFRKKSKGGTLMILGLIKLPPPNQNPVYHVCFQTRKTSKNLRFDFFLFQNI